MRLLRLRRSSKSDVEQEFDQYLFHILKFFSIPPIILLFLSLFQNQVHVMFGREPKRIEMLKMLS